MNDANALKRIHDPAVRKLIPVYLERRKADLEQIHTALACGDFATVSAIAHGLKGSGGLYGLQPVSDFGAALECAAMAGDTPAAQHTVDDLRNYLDRLESE